MKLYLKDFVGLTIIATIGLLVLFFANYPLKDWFPFATLIFPKLGDYSLVFLLNRFAWFIIVGAGFAFALLIAWKVDF